MSRTPVVAAVAVLVLAGCGGGGAGADPEPIIPSSSSAEPSPSEQSESGDAGEAPVMPEAAKERSDDGVRAFLAHWASVVTYSLNSGDSSSVSAISREGCESCESTIDFIAEVYDEGGSIDNGGWSVREVAFGPSLDRPLAKFDRRLEVVRRPGKKAERFPQAVSTIEFDLRWTQGAWRISEWTIRA